MLRSPWRLLQLAGLAVVIFHALAFGLWSPGEDALIYHEADLDDLYRGHVFTETYNYSPAFAWWIQPLQALQFGAFRTLIVAANMAGFVLLIGPVFAAVVLLAQLAPVWAEFQLGNLNFAAGALLVLGFRHSSAYAPLLLSKVTPGIGLVWFAARREWRSLGIALVGTALLALPAVVTHPHTWGQFAGSLLNNAELDAQIGAPIVLRGVLAVLVIAWGAVSGRRWTVPVGAALVAHVNGGGWLIVLAAVPLLRDSLRERSPADQGAAPSARTTQTSS